MKAVVKYYYLLQSKLDDMTLRERVMILCACLLLIILSWYFLLFTPQSKQLSSLKLQNSNLRQQIQLFQDKEKEIKTMLNDSQIQSFVEKHKSLSKTITEYDVKINTYQQQLITPQQLSTMLKAMLIHVKNVSIIEFKTVQEPTTLDTADSEKAKESEQDVKKQGVTVEKKEYLLKLKGHYFSISAYLKYLEQLNWQIYWKSLTYEVKNYPYAEVSIGFYTLSAKHE
jgi:MSHA biogenesis protein MshJ